MQPRFWFLERAAHLNDLSFCLNQYIVLYFSAFVYITEAFVYISVSYIKIQLLTHFFLDHNMQDHLKHDICSIHV